MSIYKTIEVKHKLTTVATDTATEGLKLSYSLANHSQPITITSVDPEDDYHDCLCLSIGQAKDLVGRLALFLSSLESIDNQHEDIESIISDYQEGSFGNAIPGILSSIS